MWLRRLCFSLCLVLAAPAVASADEVKEYKEYVALGVQMFEKGDFDSAREAFLNAYELHPNPVLLFNIASTYRREGELARAKIYYLRFIQLANPEDPRVELAQKTLDEMKDEAEAAEAKPAKPEPEPKKVEPSRAEPAPAPAPKPAPRVNRTPPRVIFEAPVERRREPASSGAGWKWTGGFLTIACAATVGAGVLDLRRARRASDELAQLGAGDAWNDEQEALYDEGQRANRRGTILSIAGGAAITTGIVFYVIGARSGSDVREERIVAAPYATGDGAGLAFTGTF